MTNIEILNKTKSEDISIANDYCIMIDKIISSITDKRETLEDLYIKPMDNYTILQYTNRSINTNELECLSSNEISEIKRLFDLGIVDENISGNTNWDFNDLTECWKQTILRREITQQEKLIFLIYFNKIHDYRLRFQLINIFFVKKLDEKERNDLLEGLCNEVIADYKRKERKQA
jgi:hypothetical protein